MVDALVLSLFTSETAVQIVNLWAVFCFQQLVSVLSLLFIFSGVLGLPSVLSFHGLSTSPPTPLPWPENQLPGAICITYMHLTTPFIVFLSNCKGHFLSSLFQSCHSFFLHNAIGSLASLHEIQMTSLYFSSHV